MKEAEVKQAVAELFSNPHERDALAEMIVEYVQPNHLSGQFVGDLLTTRTLKPGDSLVKKLRKGIEVRTLIPGSIHLSSEITLVGLLLLTLLRMPLTKLIRQLVE
jgi:hypothetical protein